MGKGEGQREAVKAWTPSPARSGWKPGLIGPVRHLNGEEMLRNARPQEVGER